MKHIKILTLKNLFDNYIKTYLIYYFFINNFIVCVLFTYIIINITLLNHLQI